MADHVSLLTNQVDYNAVISAIATWLNTYCPEIWLKEASKPKSQAKADFAGSLMYVGGDPAGGHNRTHAKEVEFGLAVGCVDKKNDQAVKDLEQIIGKLEYLFDHPGYPADGKPFDLVDTIAIITMCNHSNTTRTSLDSFEMTVKMKVRRK